MNNSEIKFTKNIFLFDNKKYIGINNIYISDVYTMYKLRNIFFNDSDTILLKNNDTVINHIYLTKPNNIKRKNENIKYLFMHMKYNYKLNNIDIFPFSITIKS